MRITLFEKLFVYIVLCIVTISSLFNLYEGREKIKSKIFPNIDKINDASENDSKWAELLVPILSDIKISWNGATKDTHEKIMKGAKWEDMKKNLQTFLFVRDEYLVKTGRTCSVTLQLTFLESNVNSFTLNVFSPVFVTNRVPVIPTISPTPHFLINSHTFSSSKASFLA